MSGGGCAASMKPCAQIVILVASTALLTPSCASKKSPVIEDDAIRLEFNDQMHSRVTALSEGRDLPLTVFGPSETLTADGREIADFSLETVARREVSDEFGEGRSLVLSGKNGALTKRVTVALYEDFPGVALFSVEYANSAGPDLRIESWTNNRYQIPSQPRQQEPAFWSFQPGSYEDRRDWVVPLRAGFQQDNYLGMNASDYGGGTPVVDVWRRDAGLAVGHLETGPRLVSLPVTVSASNEATLGVSYRKQTLLRAGESLQTFRTFVRVHHGDFFSSLHAFRDLMQRRGLYPPDSPAGAFEPLWCAWGFGEKCQPSQIVAALPTVKKLGFQWVTVDHGWQQAEGDWDLNPQKFPRGDADMRALVDRIHAAGLKAQLWWTPLAVDPGSRHEKEHPDQVLLNADGSKRNISFWDSWYLCPADPEVVEFHRRLVTKFLRDWNFDGLKLDGMHTNAAPRCYNPAHHHHDPEESVEAVPQLFRVIYETARSIKPDALVEFCPCGTSFSFYTLPYVNLTVASDPESSWQVRLKGKALKALTGDGLAYFGDHVELSDGADDFASTLGVGGVVGSNFTWPVGTAVEDDVDLTPKREQLWRKWVALYREKMLSRGQYLGSLYDIGFDRPEAHAIRKGDLLYYAFFAHSFEGEVELRGLEARPYRLTDYEHDHQLGTVNGPLGRVHVRFDSHLLIEAAPQ